MSYQHLPEYQAWRSAWIQLWTKHTVSSGMVDARRADEMYEKPEWLAVERATLRLCDAIEEA